MVLDKQMTEKVTSKDVTELEKIDAHYKPLSDAAIKEARAVMDAWQAIEERAQREGRFFTPEEESIGNKIAVISNHNAALTKEWLDARAKITARSQNDKRDTDVYGGNIKDIVNIIKTEVPRQIIISSIFAGLIIDKANNTNSSPKHDDWGFSDENLRVQLHKTFASYLAFLEKASPEAYIEISEFIDACISDKNNIIAQAGGSRRSHKVGDIPTVRTKIPEEYITTVDKVSNKTFSPDNDALYTQQLIAIGVERRGSKKEINTLLSISFEELEKKGVHIDPKKLTPFDREVHDAIITLFIEGGNELMSLEMLYRTITGDPKARLTRKQAEAISNSVTKLMHTIITIDATEEARAYKFDSFKYRGNLLYAEMAIASINGNVIEAIHIIKEPVLYSYANKTNKIGRVSLKLLNTPVNKNEETIILQGYLYRRILSMKGSKRLAPTIVYDTVYKQIELNAISDGALRKKKVGIRRKIKDILGYWEQEKFIIGYSENTHGQEAYSITIKL